MTARPPELSPEHIQALDRDLFETLPGGLVHVRADGSIVTANAEAQRILGLRLDRLTQRYVADFETETIHEDGSLFAAADYPVSRALATGVAQPGVTIGVRQPSGAVVWAVFRATPVRDPESHAVVGALVSFLDISERKRGEDEMHGQRELLRIAQKMTNVGSWEWNLARGTVLWSEEMYRLYDTPDFDGTLERSIERLHPDDVATMRSRIERVVQDGAHTGLEYRMIRRDGTQRTIWGVGEVFRDANGTPVKMVGIAQDVTEQRMLEEQVRMSQRLETVGRLAGGVAHDFNNLLQVITANVDAGLRYGDPLEALRDIGLAAERAAELTRQLLAFGRRSPFQAVPFSPSDVLRELMRLLPSVVGDDVRIDLDLPDTLPSLLGDPGQLLQVLMNLSINARDAMPRGGKVTLRARALEVDPIFRRTRPWVVSERHVELSVADTGTGMDPVTLSKVFEPFFTTKPVGSGSGLGLAVAYGIVQQHGGQIEVDSALGVGSTFRVYLPARERSHDRTTAKKARASTPPPPLSVSQPGRVVLVVEDEQLVRRTVEAFLSQAGFVVIAAADAAGALQAFEARAGKIDVVVTDVQMPTMNGYELADLLRARAPQLPIVFTSGAAPARPAIGSDPTLRVLDKPYAPEALLRTIESLLPKR